MFRLAEETDIEQITKLYEHIHDAEESGNAVIGWKRDVYPTKQTALEGVSEKDMFVEEIDNIIVAAGRINQKQVKEYEDCAWRNPASDQEVMVLHTLVVDPRIKGKGYGTAFVEFYKKYALENKCYYLRIDTQEKNTAARKLYKMLGFREAGVVSSNFNGIPDVKLVCMEKKLKTTKDTSFHDL